MMISSEPTIKLNWNHLIVKYSDLCGKFYALSATNQAAGLTFIKYVKVLEAYLCRYWPDDWQKKRKDMVDVMHKAHPKEAKDGDIKFEIQKYYNIFVSLMKMINDADLIL